MRNSWRRPDEEGRGEEKSRMWQRIQSRPDFSEEKARVWENVRQRSEDYASEKQRVWAEVGKAEHSPGFGKASAGPQAVRVERGMFRAERRRVRANLFGTGSEGERAYVWGKIARARKETVSEKIRVWEKICSLDKIPRSVGEKKVDAEKKRIWKMLKNPSYEKKRRAKFEKIVPIKVEYVDSEKRRQEEKIRIWCRVCRGIGRPSWAWLGSHREDFFSPRPIAAPAEEERTECSPGRKRRVKKAVACSFACVAVVAVGTVCAFRFLPRSDDGPRYCTQADYTISDAGQTLKEYAQSTGTNLLYFDWYENAFHLEDYTYRLNDSQEIVCFQEDIINGETGDYVKIYVVNSEIQIDILESYHQRCVTVNQYDNIDVYWTYSQFESNAYFTYENYTYYLSLDQPMEENSILSLIETLLP